MSVDPLSSYEEVLAKTRRVELEAEPILNHKGSPWIALKRGVLVKVKSAVGQAAYRAHEGAGLTPREAFIVQALDRINDHILIKSARWKRAKIKISRELTGKIEHNVLYRILFGKDLQRWRIEMKNPFYSILLYDPKTGKIYKEKIVKTRFPMAYSFLHNFRNEIIKGANYKQFGKNSPFFFIYRVDDHTFAPYKVMWKEVGTKVDAVVVSNFTDPFVGDKPIIPDYTCVYIPLKDENEAHFVCAVLNSAVSECITSYIHLHPDPHVLDYVKVPLFDRKASLHTELVKLSKKAHKLASESNMDELSKIKEEIDNAVAKLYGLTNEELKEVKNCLKLLEGEEVEAEFVEEESMEVTVDFLNAVANPNIAGSFEVAITNPPKSTVEIELQLPDRKVKLKTDKEQETFKVKTPPLPMGEHKIPYKIISQDKVAKGEFTLHVKEKKRFRKDESLTDKLDELLGEG